MKRNLFAAAALLVSFIFGGNAYAADFHIGPGAPSPVGSKTYANLEAMRRAAAPADNKARLGDTIYLYGESDYSTGSTLANSIWGVGSGTGFASGTLTFDLSNTPDGKYTFGMAPTGNIYFLLVSDVRSGTDPVTLAMGGLTIRDFNYQGTSTQGTTGGAIYAQNATGKPPLYITGDNISFINNSAKICGGAI